MKAWLHRLLEGLCKYIPFAQGLAMQVERLLLLKTYKATTAVINHQFIWMLRKGRKIGVAN